MSSSLISALSGGEEAAFQEQLKRQFRENLARDPAAMEAYNKATGNETPWYSPSSLRAMENERQAAARRANQMASGAQAIRETAIAQGRNVAVSPEGQIQISDPDPSKAIGKYAVRPSGLMQSQVEELPGGFKAVYDREGRLVGTNAPVQVKADAATKSPGEFMDAVDRTFFNKGDSTAAERAALYPAMEAAVRQQRNWTPPTPLSATSIVRPPEVKTAEEIAAPFTQGATNISPSTPGGLFLNNLLNAAAGPLQSAQRPTPPPAPPPVPAETSVARRYTPEERAAQFAGGLGYGSTSTPGEAFINNLLQGREGPLQSAQRPVAPVAPSDTFVARRYTPEERAAQFAPTVPNFGAPPMTTGPLQSAARPAPPPLSDVLSSATQQLPAQEAARNKAQAEARVARAERTAKDLQKKLESGKLTGAELEKAQQDYAKAQSEYLALTLTPAQQEEMARKAMEGGYLDVPGIFPRIGRSVEAERLAILDNFRNLISRPLGRTFLGSAAQPDSNEYLRYLMEQELLQQAQGR